MGKMDKVREFIGKIRKPKKIEDSINYIGITNKIVFILIDNKEEQLRDYLNTIGIKVELITSDIEEIRLKTLVEERPLTLIIIDSGTGKYTHMSARKEIYDLIGICTIDDRDTRVYYTRGVLKSDYFTVGGEKTKKIRWEKYSGMASIINREFIGNDNAKLNVNFRENTRNIENMEDNNNENTSLESLLDFKGEQVKAE